MGDLILVTKGNVSIEVSIKKIEPEGVVKPNIVQLTEDGTPIENAYKSNGQVFKTYNKIMVKAGTLEEIPKQTKIIDHIQQPDGSLSVAIKPTATKVVKFEHTYPLSNIPKLLQSALYEVYTETKEDAILIGKEIEAMLKDDVAYVVSPFSWKAGSYTQYHAVFIPHVEENGKFVLILETTQGKTVLNHLMAPIQMETPKVKVKTLDAIASLLQ